MFCIYVLISEKIVVPVDKPYITLSGTNASSTIITWNEAWFNQQSPTVSILASDFVGRYLTIQVQEKNTFSFKMPYSSFIPIFVFWPHF